MRIQADCAFALPGSKSHANRAIVAASLGSGHTVLHGATACDDVEVMVENLKTMGFQIHWQDKDCGEISIKGGIPTMKRKAVLDCHNAGTTIRFLASLASRTPGEWTLTGDAYMRKRPIGDLVAALNSSGAVLHDTNGCPPIHIAGGTMKGGHIRLKADQSSQFLTSLLLVAPTLPGGLSIEVAGELTSSGYVDLTMKVMKDFGIQVRKEKNTFFVQESEYLSPDSYDIEGDWSSAGPWLVLSALTGSSIAMTNLQRQSDQSDSKLPSIIERLQKSGDQTIDCSEVPDQTMNLAVFAAFRKGNTVLTGIENLRKKECDRIHVTAVELSKAGVSIVEKGDELHIRGAGSLEKITKNAKAVTLDPHGDHRMAMCYAILGLIRGNITIKDPDCVKKSYPNFFRDLETVIRSGKTVSIVGMRGVGKSALGRKLSGKIGMKHVDSDHVFEDRYGPIRDFIAAHGWDEFRKKEEEVIASLIIPGTVLSLGGGALGSAATRKLIKQKTVALWLQAKESELIKRLQNGKRPPLTNLPLHEEVRKFLLERGPHYREVAAMEISPKLRFSEQVPYVLKTLRDIFLRIPPKPRR